MRSLPFPSAVQYHRESSYEQQTYDPDIPIDPALGGPEIDPAIMGGESPLGDMDVS